MIKKCRPISIVSRLGKLFVNGLHCVSTQIETLLCIYMKLFVILYADDIVLIAESAEDLQKTIICPLKLL